MIKTFRKPIINSRARGHLFKEALMLLAGVATMMGFAAVPAGATPSAAARTAPPNQAPRSAVAVAFDSTGSGFAFYRGADHAVYMRTFFGAGRWSAQHRIGGHIVGAPAAAVARTTVVVAARGTDNTLRLRMMHNGAWGRWTSWGGTLSASPAITGTSLGRIDVFIRGADHALWARTLRPGQPLTPWKRLGGHLSTAPAAATADGVAAGGPDHFVQVASSPGWAWTSLGGRRTYSTPAIGFVPRTNGGWILIRGTDNTLWGKGPQILPGVKWQRISSKLITGAPTAAGTRQPAPHIITVVRDTNRAPWTASSAGSSWSPFTRPWIPQG